MYETGIRRIMEYPELISEGYSIVDILMEAYVGKTAECKQCEKYCDSIIAKIKALDMDITKEHVSRSDPDVKKLEETIASIFKVKGVRIYFMENKDINVCTYPSVYICRYVHQKAMLQGKQQNMKINIFVYEPTLTTCDITGGELFAALLHEIGHNFYWCPIAIMTDIAHLMLFGVDGVVDTIYDYVKFHAIAGGVDIVNKYVPVIGNVLSLASRLWAEIVIFKQPFGIIKSIYNLFTTGAAIPHLISSAINSIISRPHGYYEEKAADSLAAKYGYGPELTSFLKKLDLKKDTVYGKIITNTGPIGEALADLTVGYVTVIALLTLNEHPNDDQRARSIIKKLRRDLETGDFPPEAKKDLISDINRLEKQVDVLNTVSDDPDGISIRKGIYTVIDKVTKGHNDFREIFSFYFDSYNF